MFFFYGIAAKKKKKETAELKKITILQDHQWVTPLDERMMGNFTVKKSDCCYTSP